MVIIIAIGGRSGSGKTNVAKMLGQSIKSDIKDNQKQNLPVSSVFYISMDNFYKDTGEDANYNYDYPDAFDWEQIIMVLRRIRKNKKVNIPIYDYIHSKQSGEYISYEPCSVVIFEGILSLHEKITNLFDICVYIDADSDICLWRRIERDVAERGRTINSCGKQFFYVTKKGANEYIIPTKKNADFIIANNYIENLGEITQSNGYKTLVELIELKLDRERNIMI